MKLNNINDVDSYITYKKEQEIAHKNKTQAKSIAGGTTVLTGVAVVGVAYLAVLAFTQAAIRSVVKH